MGMLGTSEAARAIHAECVGKDVTFSGVATDSRAIKTGDLFVALKGDKFDGHEFVEKALAAGAVAVMVDHRMPGDMPAIVVADTRLGLGELAAHWRSRFSMPVVAVTGSNGKTTVKEMIASILQASCEPAVANAETQVLATQGNLNNDIGMPLTLLGLRKQHRYAVIEMGMNHPGEIAYLSKLAKPDVAVINNAHAAHLEGLKTVEEVARAKGEIFEGLQQDGVAVINADDAYAPLWQKMAAGHRVIEFGLKQAAAVTATCRLSVTGSEVLMRIPQGEVAVSLQVPGLHNVRNALAATAVAVALNIPGQAIAEGLAKFAGVKGRLQRKHGLHGAVLIDDTYNANPDSVKAAIAVLAAAPGKKILVLGDMGELGPGAVELHAEIGAQAKQAGLDMLFALGDLSRHAVESFGTGGMYFERIQELLADLENLLTAEATVLIKGSRFMQMERVVKSFEVRNEK